MNRLGYQFLDPKQLALALTHRSYSRDNNERLEFLGDSLLNFTIGEALYRQLPSAKEGDLSRLRAGLVKGDTLAEVAQELSLGDFLNLGEGELKSGGFRRASILADALEAVFGALYLDGGIDAVQHCILNLFADRLSGITLQNTQKDPKTRLQEWLQARRLPLPEYHVIDTTGESHNQVFTVQCTTAARSQSTTASASNRRTAEKEAAQAMLELLSGTQS